jgi:hypothetical protein
MHIIIIIIIIIFHKSEISAFGRCRGLDSNYCPRWKGLKFIIIFKCIPNLRYNGAGSLQSRKVPCSRQRPALILSRKFMSIRISPTVNILFEESPF